MKDVRPWSIINHGAMLADAVGKWSTFSILNSFDFDSSPFFPRAVLILSLSQQSAEVFTLSRDRFYILVYSHFNQLDLFTGDLLTGGEKLSTGFKIEHSDIGSSLMAKAAFEI